MRLGAPSLAVVGNHMAVHEITDNRGVGYCNQLAAEDKGNKPHFLKNGQVW